MEKKLKVSSRVSTKKLTVFAMFTAISVILGFTPLGIIPIPPVGATIMHIPVIIMAVLEGPIAGALMGLVFGIISVIRAITTGNVLLFAFLNPLVSVAPRILIGVAAYYFYKFTPGKSDILKVGMSAAVGTFTNTVGFLGMMYILYAEKAANVLNVSKSGIGKTLLTVATTNGIPEIIVAVVITVPVVIGIKKTIKK